ncbi:hypothetical protein [Azotobacter vinelandii]|uniref:hypothetical protein n=1 Tax=Azotobacter vinelandii TaxID=354 RepID=UPI0007747A68|nr:hypothetical protein [Azotobacter vinelandii]
MRLRFRSPSRFAVLLLGLAVAPFVQAAPQADAIPSAFRETAARHGVPAEVLHAMARAESGRRLKTGAFRAWPWTLNIAGKGQVYDTRAEACVALRAALERTRSVDVGIAQLNVRWNPDLFGPGRRFPEPCAGLDPYANLDAAAAKLRAHFEATGDWLQAAGRYHRPAGGSPARRYAQAVARHLAAGFDARQRPRISSRPFRPSPSPASTRAVDPALPSASPAPVDDLVWIPATAVTWIPSGG